MYIKGLSIFLFYIALFQEQNLSKLLQSHSTQAFTTEVHDIHQTWKEWYGENGIFQGDSRGLALALCTDGTNPYSKEKNAYSMWPITLSILNLHLPSSLRSSAGTLPAGGI